MCEGAGTKGHTTTRKTVREVATGSLRLPGTTLNVSGLKALIDNRRAAEWMKNKAQLSAAYETLTSALRTDRRSGGMER